MKKYNFYFIMISPSKNQKSFTNSNENRQFITDANFVKIFYISKNYSKFNSYAVWKLFYMILDGNKECIDQSSILQQYQEIQSQISVNLPDSSLQTIICHIQQNSRYYMLDVLSRLILKDLLDQNRFITKFSSILSKEMGPPTNMDLRNDSIFSNMYSSCSIQVDNDLNFMLCKSYFINGQCNQTIEREKRLFIGKYSKFIVYPIEASDSCVTIPHFPAGTLASICREEHRGKLTLVDKVVIVLELSIALRDLHNGHFCHGGLSSDDVFLSASGDAYLASFCCDAEKEREMRVTNGRLFCRAPEFFDRLEHGYFKDGSCYEKDEEGFRFGQSLDIFALGAVMYEVITQTPLSSRIGSTAGRAVSDIFKGSEFSSKRMAGMKEVVEKCMQMNPADRFASVEQVIESVKSLPVYVRNKEEIEFRIESALDSLDYACTLSDIVECCYRGYGRAKEDIERFLSVYKGCQLDKIVDVKVSENITRDMLECFGLMNENGSKNKK